LNLAAGFFVPSVVPGHYAHLITRPGRATDRRGVEPPVDFLPTTL
jgi:hypothetical protein